MSHLPPFPAPYPNHTGNGNDPNMQFWNGTGTNPGPLLPYIIRPVNNWTQTDRRIHMVTPGSTITPEDDVRVPFVGTDIVQRGVWASPVFDLAPMLGSTTVAQGGVVLGRGPDARLTLQLDLRDSQNKLLNAYICERAHAFDAAQVRAVSPAKAVGALLGDRITTLQRPTLNIAAPECGVRYWQVFLVLDCMSTAPATPFDFTITATAY